MEGFWATELEEGEEEEGIAAGRALLNFSDDTAAELAAVWADLETKDKEEEDW